MPQLDITINLIWVFFNICGKSFIFKQYIYIYIPFFIRYWKFNELYKFNMTLLYSSNYLLFVNFIKSVKYNNVGCVVLSYALPANYNDCGLSTCGLEVENYSNHGFSTSNSKNCYKWY